MNMFMQQGAPVASDAAPIDKPWGALIVLALSAIVLLVLYQYAMKGLYRYLVAHAYEQASAFRTLFIFRYSYIAVAMMMLIAIFGKSLVVIGLSLGFIATLLAWGIQGPIMNLAGWLMLISIKPYRVGDRVILEGNIGDVKDISTMYTLLEQVGGTIGGEEKSGRAQLIPNMHLFGWTIVNYSRNEPFILDEVPVRVTYDSNLDRAEELLIASAREVLGNLVDETGLAPYVRHEFIPSGIISRIRYRVPPQRRQEYSSRIVNSLFSAVNPDPEVRFCYVQSVNLVTQVDETSPLPPMDPRMYRWGMGQPGSRRLFGRSAPQASGWLSRRPRVAGFLGCSMSEPRRVRRLRALPLALLCLCLGLGIGRRQR